VDGPVALLWGCFFCLEVPEPVEGPLEAPLCGSTSSPTVVRQAAGSYAAKHQPWFDGPLEALLRSTNRGLADYFFL